MYKEERLVNGKRATGRRLERMVNVVKGQQGR